MRDKHIDYKQFYRNMLIAVNHDRMSRRDRDENISDEYTIYKEQNESDFLSWVQQHLHEDDVNPDSHDFWLDRRGVALLYIEQNLYKH